ncbi:MAG: DUF2164 domain-containing protein [Thermoplasmatota archaeon]
MAQITFPKETRDGLLALIKRFAAEELEEDWGDLRASRLLDFVLKEIAPSVYNQAARDSQKVLQERLDEMAETVYVPEFAFWRR